LKIAAINLAIDFNFLLDYAKDKLIVIKLFVCCLFLYVNTAMFTLLF